MEQDHNYNQHLVAFISRTLKQHEQNYAAHDLELLRIVDILRTWRFYLYGQKFVVQTDHHPLKYLEAQEFLTPRRVHLIEHISMFDFDILLIRRKSNRVADGLSRKIKDHWIKRIIQRTAQQSNAKKQVLWVQFQLSYQDPDSLNH